MSTLIDLSVFLQFNRIKSILGGVPDSLVEMKDEAAADKTNKTKSKQKSKDKSKEKTKDKEITGRSAEVMEMMKLAA